MLAVIDIVREQHTNLLRKGRAPHRDLQPMDDADRPRLGSAREADWIRASFGQKALTLAASTLVPEHFQEIAARLIPHVDKTLAAVHKRLSKEINYWSDRWTKLRDDKQAGKES
jgi:hypothetical protein